MARRLAACLALLSLIGASAADAQQRVFAVTPGSDPSALWEARMDGGQVVDAALRAVVPGTVYDDPIVAGGGRFVVWPTYTSSGAGALALFDRQTGVSQLVPYPGVSAPVPDPTATRLYFSVGGQIGRMTATGVSLVPNTADLTAIGVSVDGRRLYALRRLAEGPPPLSQVEVIDAATGTLMAAAPLGSIVSVRVADDETAAWVVTNVGSVPTLRKLAVPGGDERLSIPLPERIPFPPYAYGVAGIDTSLRRVFVVMNQVGARYSFPGEVRSFDTETGAAGPVVPTAGVSSVFLDSAAGRVLVHSAGYLYGLGCSGGTIQVLSAVTGEETSRISLGATGCLRVAFAAPPAAPVLDAPVVSSARSVTLSWTPSPELTTHVTVEAGSAPGLANLAALTVPTGTTLTVPDVPSGTYYVRVKAANYIGDSGPSNEIVVTVP